MPDLETQPYIAPEHRAARPNDDLNALLQDYGFGYTADDLYDNASLRQGVIIAARDSWRDSFFYDSTARDLMVHGHTVEAMQPIPDADFLSNSIEY